MSARFAKSSNGILLTIAVPITKAKSEMNSCQRVIGVATEMRMNERTVRIFRCDGRECVTEWRCR